RAPQHVVGFTADVPRYMDLADFFIGKPGPSSISEAVQRGLPVIVVDNAWTMPQERYNARWVVEHGLGVAHRSHRTIGRAVDALLAELPGYRARARVMHNRALYEIPQILAHVLASGAGEAPSRAQLAAASGAG